MTDDISSVRLENEKLVRDINKRRLEDLRKVDDLPSTRHRLIPNQSDVFKGTVAFVGALVSVTFLVPQYLDYQTLKVEIIEKTIKRDKILLTRLARDLQKSKKNLTAQNEDLKRQLVDSKEKSTDLLEELEDQKRLLRVQLDVANLVGRTTQESLKIEAQLEQLVLKANDISKHVNEIEEQEDLVLQRSGVLNSEDILPEIPL